MLAYWVWFAQNPNISGLQKRQLLEHFSDPEELYFAREETLPEEKEAALPLLQKLTDRDLTQAQQIVKDCAKKKIRLLTYRDDAYPRRLRNIDDAPMVLYYRGTLPELDTVPVIGIVGTRKATAYGLTAAKRISSQIAACGALVLSGGAFGIDTAAMQGALNSGCPTVGVLGCGVDVVYPRSNTALFEKVLESGCLISEYPPGTQPLKWHFPQRNRIISGICNGVLVVEAPQRSGALITARLAFEQGRDVFVVPGNIDNPSSEGSNALLQERASAVFSGWDVVREYTAQYPGNLRRQEPVPCQDAPEPPKNDVKSPSSHTKSTKNEKMQKKAIDKAEPSPYSGIKDTLSALGETERAIAQCLTEEPRPVDEIVALTGFTTGRVLSTLTMLALKGVAVNHPGNRVSLKK